MSFIDNLPKAAESAYLRAVHDRTPDKWYYIVKLCVREGIFDPNKLADIPFYLHHPELANRDLRKHEYLLIGDWWMWNSIVCGMIPKMQTELKPPLLRTWLGGLDTDKLGEKKWKGNENEQTIKLRKQSLFRLREYLLRATKKKVYNTSYWTYEYVDGGGRHHIATERTFMVEGFKKDDLKQDILQILTNALERCGHDCKNFGRDFVVAEERLYANVDVPVRWQQGSPTSDGPTAYVYEMKCLKELSEASKSEYSIYWIYREHLQNAYRAATDPNPKTAGM